MRALLAIAAKTIRSSLRSHVVHVVLGVLLLAITLLPLTISDDGTARGHIQVSLTYTLGVVGFLLAIVSLWLGCVNMADDIDGHQIHMVAVKPVPRPMVWVGKWLGIVVLQGVLLAIAGALILGLMQWRVRTAEFSEVEMVRLKKEVLVGRRVFRPEQADISRLAKQELKRRVETGATIPEPMTPDAILDAVRRQIKAQLMEVPVGAVKIWRFRDLPAMPPNSYVNLRYRLYLNSAKSRDQRLTHGAWMMIDEKEKRMLPLTAHNGMGARFQEIALPTQLFVKDKPFVLGYANQDHGGKSVIFQHEDGPSLLIEASGFWQNYARVLLLIFVQIMFFSALGCTCGAGLSTPVAIFIAFSYLSLGFIMAGMDIGNSEELLPPPGFFDRAVFSFNHMVQRVSEQSGLHMKAAFAVRTVAEMLVVSLDEFNEVTRLAKGELVEFGRIVTIFFRVLVLHGVPVAVIGMWVLIRREFGLVVRQ